MRLFLDLSVRTRDNASAKHLKETMMPEEILRIGNRPDKAKFGTCVHERKGFLNIFRYAIFGQDGKAYYRDIMERGRASVVMPVDFTNRHVYMIRQPRPIVAFAETEEGRACIAEAGRKGIAGRTFEIPFEAIELLEMPAGVIDPGETPEQTAIRELREETGIEIAPDDLIPVATYYPSIGGSSEIISAFIARLTPPVEFSRTDGDGHEIITVIRMTWDEAFRALDERKIRTASSNILLRELRLLSAEG